jgi:2-phospho-L-lactate guanylyltransferase
MPDDRVATRRGAIVIPVKAFDKAKERLAGALSNAERSALAQRTATRVVEVAKALPQFDEVIVVCDDHETAQWAQHLGITALVSSQPGLNAAVTHAVAHARATHDWVAVCHADIADPRGLAALTPPPRQGIVLVPDRHGLGTNVLMLNTSDDFTFHYGPTSCADHTAEATRRGLTVTLVRDAGLALDLDTPDDVALLDTPQ